MPHSRWFRTLVLWPERPNAGNHYTHTTMDPDNNCFDESVFFSFFCIDVNLVDTNEKVLLRNEVHKNSLVQNSHVHSIVPFKHFIFFSFSFSCQCHQMHQQINLNNWLRCFVYFFHSLFFGNCILLSHHLHFLFAWNTFYVSGSQKIMQKLNWTKINKKKRNSHCLWCTSALENVSVCVYRMQECEEFLLQFSYFHWMNWSACNFKVKILNCAYFMVYFIYI